jgi:hypothetical protein
VLILTSQEKFFVLISFLRAVSGESSLPIYRGTERNLVTVSLLMNCGSLAPKITDNSDLRKNMRVTFHSFLFGRFCGNFLTGMLKKLWKRIAFFFS